jgi:hypothetical protein
MTTRSPYDPEIDNEDSPDYWPENPGLVRLRKKIAHDNEALLDEHKVALEPYREILEKNQKWRSENLAPAAAFITAYGRAFAKHVCRDDKVRNDKKNVLSVIGYYSKQFAGNNQKSFIAEYFTAHRDGTLMDDLEKFFLPAGKAWLNTVEAKDEDYQVFCARADAAEEQWIKSIDEGYAMKFARLAECADLVPEKMLKTPRPQTLNAVPPPPPELIDLDAFPDASVNLCTRCPAAAWEGARYTPEVRNGDGVIEHAAYRRQDFHLVCECGDNQEKKWTLKSGTGVFECSKRPAKIEAALARMSAKNEQGASARPMRREVSEVNDVSEKEEKQKGL